MLLHGWIAAQACTQPYCMPFRNRFPDNRPRKTLTVKGVMTASHRDSRTRKHMRLALQGNGKSKEVTELVVLSQLLCEFFPAQMLVVCCATHVASRGRDVRVGDTHTLAVVRRLRQEKSPATSHNPGLHIPLWHLYPTKAP
jgi:hypothetical protein